MVDAGMVVDQFVELDGDVVMDEGVEPDAAAIDAGAEEDAAPVVDMAQADMIVPMPMPEPTSDHAFMMYVPEFESGWRDLAYLSAVVASGHRNAGRPVVVALKSENLLGASAIDFMARFAPREVTVFGAPNISVDAENVQHEPLADLETTTIALADSWERSQDVVLASQSNYGNALLAASFAGRIRAPLFFFDETVSPAINEALERLGSSRVFVIGDAPELNLEGVLALDGSDSVITWLLTNEYELDYLAVVNPNDRDAGRSQKLSLTAAAYTTRRDGLVIPIATQIPADVAEGTALAEVLSQLNTRYDTMGRHPEHLALVGSFDVIPIERRPSLFDVPEREWPVTDIPYGERDDDPFRDCCRPHLYG